MLTVFKSDNQVQLDVANEILWDPRITSTHVQVSAKNGVVTLTGDVPHYYEKTAVEDAAQRVSGVKAVADEIDVKMMGIYERTDGDIAQAAINAFAWNFSVPDGIKTLVDQGWVTLSGEVDWDYQRNAAKVAVQSLMGVTGVSNLITLKQKSTKSEVKSRIEEALKRSAESEGHKIKVDVVGDQVTLSGSVHSMSEIGEAGLAAWCAPGINSLINSLKVSN
jgi:osmotically-inducible protein OsmY